MPHPELLKRRRTGVHQTFSVGHERSSIHLSLQRESIPLQLQPYPPTSPPHHFATSPLRHFATSSPRHLATSPPRHPATPPPLHPSPPPRPTHHNEGSATPTRECPS